MQQRRLGRTGLMVSEIAFGGWAIGGESFGPVSGDEALRALAVAEEAGCNLVDTAAVYGDSERILGRFLPGRRQRWLVATKYSGQPEGMRATLERQLRVLGVEQMDLYQLHWNPTGEKRHLYDELREMKAAGLARHIGVSLYTTRDIDMVLEDGIVDCLQVAFSLLDPLPLIERLEAVRARDIGVIVRSALHAGYLTGKYDERSTFDSASDQRSDWTERRRRDAARDAGCFRFLEEEAGSLLAGAVRYPLAFPEVSTVLLSSKSAAQAAVNFGDQVRGALSRAALGRIDAVQRNLGLRLTGVRRRLRPGLRRLGFYRCG